jgi:hypothetical protein
LRWLRRILPDFANDLGGPELLAVCGGSNLKWSTGPAAVFQAMGEEMPEGFGAVYLGGRQP